MEELDNQALEIEHMQFSANDLNNYSAISDQSASRTYENKKPVEAAKLQTKEEKPKNFFEEIYFQNRQN